MRVCVLGGFSVFVGARAIEDGEWRLKKAASLVKLLALEPGHRMHRERVMDLLWPESDSKAQASNLRHVLHVTRRVLGSSSDSGARYLERRGEGISLCSEVPLWVDAGAFEEAAAGARCAREPAAHEAAVGLYTGELLPDDRYEWWAEDRREGLRRLYHALLVELAGLHEEVEESESAIEALKRVVAEEPAHEAARAGLMRLYARSGRREEALGQYERLREALARDLDEPTADIRRLYEEISAGRFEVSPAPVASPPEERPVAPRHNLSEEVSSFVGRGREMAEVKRELAATRLLTLLGAGGAGKTRLARAVARDLAGTYPDGAWLVQLAPLSEGTLAPQAVAAALGVREQPGRLLDATITDHLRSRKLLLVLDNCEHVVDAAARLADGLLSACPGLHVLATSREALRVSGEAVWRVPSLSLPGSDGGAVTAKELGRSEAVRLFVERARSRRQGFELTDENAGPVAEVCRRLEGMPLAIELAAARAGVLSTGQMVERLDNSLSLLRGGGRTTEARHQTLRGALDWSYELLDEPEKKLLKRLSVFAGGWTLEAAEAVGSDGSGQTNLTARYDTTAENAQPDWGTLAASPADTKSPTTIATAKNADDSSYASDTWTNQDVTVTLSATDEGDSGLDKISYKMNDGPEQTYADPISITTAGTTTISRTRRATRRSRRRPSRSSWTRRTPKSPRARRRTAIPTLPARGQTRTSRSASTAPTSPPALPVRASPRP